MWIYFSSNQEIWRMPFNGGTAERLIEGGGLPAFESVDVKTLFYMKAVSGPLFAKPLWGGPERRLLDWVTARAFFPVKDGIYYIGAGNENGEYPLEFFRFSSQKSEVLTNLNGGIFIGLSVSPDRTTVLFTKTVAVGANLMMIENFQ